MKRTLYVNRPLVNAEAFRAWAEGQGFKDVDPDLHVTIAFSKAPLTWPDGIPDGPDAERVSGGQRSVERLGADGAVVLRFESPDLERRWTEIKAAGASWDYEGYRPHVTITYAPGDLDIDSVTPFEGPLEFGPERWQPIKSKEERAMATDGFYFLAYDSETPVGPFPTRELASRASALLSLPLPSGLAFDKDTVRVYDADGRMRVGAAPISKACVNPYLGSEIPNAEELGLTPTRVYMLFRDPEELRKGAATFNGLPILIKHEAVSAKDPKRDIIGGCTGTEAYFEDPYLYNSLSVWTEDAIEGIETDQQKELSSAYRYVADMTPGSWEGEKYDGVMRDIVGNHVALVKKGRAGPDVVVGDEAMRQPEEETDMSKKVAKFSRNALRVSTALMALYSPVLAMDKKPDFAKLGQPFALKNLLAQDGKTVDKAKLAAALKIAKDALDPMMTPEATASGGVGPDDIIMKLLDQVVGAGVAEGPQLDEAIPATAMPNAAAPAAAAGAAEATDDGNAELTAFLSTLGLPPEVVAKILAMCGGGEEAAPAAAAGAAEPDAGADDEDPDKEKKEMVTKPAMDAAIAAASAATETRVRAQQKEVHEAIAFVKPWVGEVAPLAFDSAEAVYRGALTSMGLKVEDVKDAAALKHVMAAQPKPGARRQGAPVMAADAAQVKSFAERFPHAASIGNLG